MRYSQRGKNAFAMKRLIAFITMLMMLSSMFALTTLVSAEEPDCIDTAEGCSSKDIILQETYSQEYRSEETSEPDSFVTVTFETDGGGTFVGATTVEVTIGSSLTAAQIPTPVPYDISGLEIMFSYWMSPQHPGWHVDLTDLVITEATTFRAMFYYLRICPQITFLWNDGSINEDNVFAIIWTDHGKMIDLPATPSREGYEFVGWSTDAAGNNIVDISELVEVAFRYTTFFAQWEPVSIIGVNFLFVNNQPVQRMRPTGQTPTQTIMTLTGQRVTLEEGQAPAGLEFGRWIRGSELPPVGACLDRWLIDNPTVPNFAAGHTTTVLNDDMPSVAYTAIWVANGIVGGNGYCDGYDYRRIRIYYYFNDNGGFELDMENNPHGHQHIARVGDTFDLGAVGVLDRNDLDSVNKYAFDGWLVFVDGVLYNDYISDFDTSELHSSFIVPAANVTSDVESEDLLAMSANIDGDDIVMIAIWSFYVYAGGIPGGGNGQSGAGATNQTQKGLPQTGVEGSLVLWSALMTLTLLVGISVALRIRSIKDV